MSTKQGNPPCQHTIESGDTFYNLALAYYGDGSPDKVQKIENANPGVGETTLQIGQIVNIPA